MAPFDEIAEYYDDIIDNRKIDTFYLRTINVPQTNLEYDLKRQIYYGIRAM